MKKTKIICSIGPASCSYDVMSKMVEAGMNVTRINFSHATIEERDNVIKVVKEIREKDKKFIGILFDTKGPEFRNGMLENGEINLVDGKTIRIVKEEVLGTEERFSVNHPSAIDSISVGDIILLENDLMRLECTSVEEDGITCTIINGGILGNKKSMSVPGVRLDIPFVSEEDYKDLVYACENGGEYLALSFVSCAEDVLEVKEILKKYNREDLKIIAKIESVAGIENVESILDVCEGVMVARGDLGVEVPVQELPFHQKHLVKTCKKNGKLAIVATEMLESMKKNARPTRAEVSDIAYAVSCGTDAVMLSGETTVGKYPVETVTYMAQICEQNEMYLDYDKAIDYDYHQIIPNTLAQSVKVASDTCEANLIVAATLSGYTARKISNRRPKALIMAATPDANIAYGLSLYFGVYPTIVGVADSNDELLSMCREKAISEYNLQNGDNIVITGGIKIGNKVSPTNFMTIAQI